MTKTWLIALVCTGLVSVGCAATPEEGSGMGGESETDSDSETDSETDSTGDPTTTGSTTEGPTGTETDGTTVSPTTEDPTTEDPTTEDPTTEDPTTEDPTTEDPTTEDPTTEDPTDPTTEDPTTEDPTTEDPTTGGGACNDIYVEEFGADEANLTGDWNLIMSQQGEGMVASWPQGAQDGTVTWTYNVPCADDWHVWTRMYDSGIGDSFFVLIDGEPQGWAVTEVHCYQGGGFYRWGELNWRDPEAGACDYIQDPWVQSWDAGPHELVFAYRESPAISRLIFTNDPNFTP